MKTLKRVYCKKSNLNKAFNNWDLEKKGFIDSKDLIRVSAQWALPLNKKEAKIMLYMGS